jgi:hypothetical protein
LKTLSAVSPTISLVIAVGALGVSLGTLAWSIASFWLSGPRFKVEFLHGVRNNGAVVLVRGYDPASLEVMRGQGYTAEVFGVRVRNVGRAAAWVTDWSARLDGFGWTNPLDPTNPVLPARLEPGQTLTWWADGRSVRAMASVAASAGTGPHSGLAMEVELGTGKRFVTDRHMI